MTAETPDPITTAAARYKRDKEKADKSRKELATLVLDALREPGAEPVDIARRAEWTSAYVRKLARDNHIDADPAYKARTEKARARLLAEAVAKPAPAAPRRKAAPPIADRPHAGPPARTRQEADAHVDRLYDIVRDRAKPQEWARLEQLVHRIPDAGRKLALLGQAHELLSREEMDSLAYTEIPGPPADATEES